MSEASNGQSNGIEIADGPTTADGVDWSALWEEFGFDESGLASKTQLMAALDCSEQDITADAEGLMIDAVRAGLLEPERTPTGDKDGVVLRGYRLGDVE